MSVCVCRRQDSTEWEDILLLPQENSATLQECLICNAALLHTGTLKGVCETAVVYLYQRCVFVRVFLTLVEVN